MDIKRMRKSGYLRRSRLVKEGVLFVLIQVLVFGSSTAGWFGKKSKESKKEARQYKKCDTKQILKSSHIKYRAVGGFSGVKAYSVLISCVDGKISVLKSIHDPRWNKRKPTLRRRASLSKKEYLALWDQLRRQKVLDVPSAPDPKHDILDEFTFHFEARIQKIKNSFKIYGMSRPEGSRYFAIKNIIDSASDMASFWQHHTERFASR